MNTVDMANDLINRAKNLQEFVVTTDVPEDFRFNGTIPFDMKIKDNELAATVYAVDFNEAVNTLNKFLDTCK